MATGGMVRGALRGGAALALAWLAAVAGLVAFAPSASADPTATVYIRDLTPPLVSVDRNGTVTFVNQIQDKTVGVSAGLSVVDATVHTDVTLVLPSGKHTLQSQPQTDPSPRPRSSVQEKFTQSCLTCTITYSYRVTVPNGSVVGGLLNTVVGQAVAKLPQSQVVTYNGAKTTVTIGVPTPFLVNTLVPLPNLPSVNVPALPRVNVPLPHVGAAVPPVPGGTTVPSPGPTTSTGTTTTTTTTTVHGIGGSLYAYDTGNGAPRLDPVGGGSAAFDPGRISRGGSSAGRLLPGGAGGAPGSYDSVAAPAVGLDGVRLDDAGATGPARGGRSALTLPALLAVICLAGVCIALVRTAQARRVHR